MLFEVARGVSHMIDQWSHGKEGNFRERVKPKVLWGAWLAKRK